MKKVLLLLVICLVAGLSTTTTFAQKPGNVRVYNFYPFKMFLAKKKGNLTYDKEGDKVQFMLTPSRSKFKSTFRFSRVKYPGYEKAPYKHYKTASGEKLFYTPEGYWLFDPVHSCRTTAFFAYKSPRSYSFFPMLMAYEKSQGVSPQQVKALIKKAMTESCAHQEKSLKTAKEAKQKAAFDQKELPTAQMNNKELEQKMTTMIKEHYKRNKWKLKLLRVIIISNDWSFKRYKYSGNIKNRYLRAVGVFTHPERCGYHYFRFFQKYQGGGKYQQTLNLEDTAKIENLPCSKVK